MDEEVETQNTNTSDSLDAPSPSNIVDDEVRQGSPNPSRPESRNEPRSRQISRTSSSRDRDVMDEETKEKIMKILQEGRIAMEAEGRTSPSSNPEGGGSMNNSISNLQSSSGNPSPDQKVPRQVRRKPVVLPLPLLAERRNSEGRKRRAPPSREYDPVEHHAVPLSTKRKSKSSFDPNSALQSLCLDTPDVQEQVSPSLSSPRSDRPRSKNSTESIPQLFSKTVKKEIKKDILSPVKIEDPNLPQAKKKRRKRGAAARMLTRKKRSTISRDEFKSESHEFSKKIIESSSEESEDESNDADNLVDFGEDGIKFLKDLSPKFERSTRRLEKKFRKEFFLRTILFPPEPASEKSKPTNGLKDDIQVDKGDSAESTSGLPKEEVPKGSDNIQEDQDLMEVDQKPLVAEIKQEIKDIAPEEITNPLDKFMKRYSLATSKILESIKSERLSMAEIAKLLKSSKSFKSPTLMGIRFDNEDFKALKLILKKIHLQEKIILSSRAIGNSMTNMFIKSRELASRIPLIKNKCFLKAHDWILIHGSEDVVYGYLTFLSYLKPAVSCFACFYFQIHYFQNSKYEFIDNHHLNKLTEISNLITDVLRRFVRDPFIDMFKKWKRLFLLPDIHVIAFHCGTDFRGKAEIEGFDERRKTIL